MRITDQMAQKAFDFIRNNENEAVRLEGEWRYLDSFTKSLKAVLMRESGESSIGAQETWALASDKYQEHLKELNQAHQAHLLMHARMERAHDTLRLWQTSSANLRGGI